MMKFTSLLVIGFLTACGNPDVTITYHQIGACNGFPTNSGETNVGPNQAYVVFGIEKIDNPNGSGATFNFDPNKLFVNSTVKDFVNTSDLIFSNILGPFSATTATITQGNSINFAVSAQVATVVQTAASDGAVEANKTNYTLLYNVGSGDPGVILVKSDASQTSWPLTENCQAISLH
jgi:hypothetical protein